MSIKNKKKITLFTILFSFILTKCLFADVFDITASKIKLIDDNKKIVAEGGVLVKEKNSNITIEAENVDFDKEKNILNAENSVKITNQKNNDEIKSNKIQYFKNLEKIISIGDTFVNLNNLYDIITKDLIFFKNKKIIKSDKSTKIKDNFGNLILLDSFNYSTLNKDLKSKGYIEITDKLKNKYFFDTIYIDVDKKRMAGSNLKINFENKTFGNAENEPRLVANSAVITENKSFIENGVFTTCKRKKEKCPPWKLTAKKIIHDKIKKTINYKNARLDVYGIPVMFLPKFFHPDPTVERQSGFLIPSINNSNALGSGFNIPYYFALADHKDLTLSPKIYVNENPVIQTEYRHLTKNTYSIFDTSYNQGYKNTSATKTKGSRNHFFARSNIALNFDSYDESNLLVNIQRVSNDTYLRVYDINSKLMSNNTLMTSALEFDFSKNNSTLDLDFSSYENLNKSDERYEFVAPNYDYKNNILFSEKLGELNFQSRGYHKEYETNKKQTKLVNDFLWSSNTHINNLGIITKFEGNLKNSNYNTEREANYKSENNNYEIAGAVSLTSSLPLEKERSNYTKIFTPKMMLRTAPGHMRNINNDQLRLNTSNLFSLNKLNDIDVIEKGTSLTLGTDYSYLNKDDFEKFKLSLGQVYNLDYNNKMSSQSSLNKKTSELVGNLKYNINQASNIKYKFSLDENLNDLNYNEISGKFRVNKLVTNFDYIEENNHIGDNHFINAGLSLEIDGSNSLNFKTRENFKTNTTEFYNLSYQYENDCLIAGVEYNKQFYSDRDLQPTENLMFTLTIIPFGKITSPAFQGN